MTSTVQASEQQQTQVTSAAPDVAPHMIAVRRPNHDQKQAAAHRQMKTETAGGATVHPGQGLGPSLESPSFSFLTLIASAL